MRTKLPARLDENWPGLTAICRIERIRELSRTVGIPERLDALKSDDIPALARAAMIEAHRDYPVPRDMTLEDAQALLGRMLPQGA